MPQTDFNPKTESIYFKGTPARQRLLVVFAHPDDESFGPAGTLIHYAQRGVAVHYVCATRGEAGTVPPDLLTGYDSIADLRTAELRCAAQPLGLTGLHLLNYHDSGMENTPQNNNPACLFQAPLAQVTERVTRLMRQIQPQVVLTFDPSGGYFHPDHIKIHQVATAAFHAAGDAAQFPQQLEAGLTPHQPQKLYYTAFPRGFLKLMIKILPLFGKDPEAMGENKDLNLKRMVSIEASITTKINVASYFEARQQAAQCHASQLAGIRNVLPDFLRKWLFRFDTYTRIVPPATQSRTERDLFADII